jgi:hypothetical protein
MLELLFIVALIAWVVVSTLQYLAGLPAAPTLLVAAILLPLLALWRSRVLARQGGIYFVRSRRRPLPPERFYWPATRRKLGRRAIASVLVTVLVWPLALGQPARWSIDQESITGWLAGAIGIIALSEACAAIWLYVRASQRFDKLAPVAVGWLRRGLYRISDNHEFLGEEPLPRQKRARESVY